ncbi:unknown protein [Microcystis aeruginosa NIES-843]|uniref:Uncharacterized protein n=1 Tax=Microcystis aeruginosa (strain NIES-843 / IAM M-2473) TaxID=449447 RepID=B0JP50_MICAN|nr:unknown protein [Microcystis aeruginosa NIES-843]
MALAALNAIPAKSTIEIPITIKSSIDVILPVPGQPWASVWVRVCKWSKNSKKKEIEKWAS